jgi:outer membrane protein OmpA-like peptidoglycan-associated protein
MVIRAAVAGVVLGLSTIVLASAPETAVQVRQIRALTYPEGPTISVKLEGTSRLPLASGEAKVERKKGMTEIEIELDELKPATAFGGDYNTYVLWIVSPEGHVDNVGEFILQGNRSKLDVSTPLETFGMLVSAEPHFLVGLPSRFVVLENSEPTVDLGPLKVSKLRYRGHEGIYVFDNESLVDVAEAKGEQRAHIESARTAVALAERAGAARFSQEELARAREALDTAERRYREGTTGQNEMLLAHEVIRLAVDAEKVAVERGFESALSHERQVNSDRVSALSASIGAAKSEAERSRLEAEQKALDAELSANARRAAEQEAAAAGRRAAQAEQRAHEAERRRLAAEEAKLDAEREKVEAERVRTLAEQEAAEARREREKAHDALREALSGIAAVRESARGLVVSLPNILFESGRADLKPEGREALAKISGVLLIANGYRMSIEGHTDNVGAPDFNLDLSRRRAESVRDYLSRQGLSPAAMLAIGFGESRPVASNETHTGRQENRRVEIVVLDFGVGLTSQ